MTFLSYKYMQTRSLDRMRKLAIHTTGPLLRTGELLEHSAKIQYIKARSCRIEDKYRKCSSSVNDVSYKENKLNLELHFRDLRCWTKCQAGLFRTAPGVHRRISCLLVIYTQKLPPVQSDRVTSTEAVISSTVSLSLQDQPSEPNPVGPRLVQPASHFTHKSFENALTGVLLNTGNAPITRSARGARVPRVSAPQRV